MRGSEGRRVWGWRSAVAAVALLIASSYGCLAYVGRPLAWPGSPLPFLAVAVVAGLAAWALMSGRAARYPAWPFWVGAGLATLASAAWYARYEPTHAPYADNADALRLGVTQLLHGRSPYAVHTFLGGPITPMVGGFVLALPFVALTNLLFWQQIVWLLGAVAALARAAGPRAACAAAGLFFVAPWSRMALPYQSDTWICAVAVALTGSLGHHVLRTRRDLGAWWWVTSLLFGVALAYRFILWIAVVPLCVALIRRYGLRRAAAWLAPAGVVTVALAALPLLTDAHGYLEGPIGTGLSKANHDSVPGGMLLVAAATVGVLAVASRRARSLAGVWGATAAALAAMVLTICLTKVPALGLKAFSTYDTLAYNGAFLVFGLLSLALPQSAPTGLAPDPRQP